MAKILIVGDTFPAPVNEPRFLQRKTEELFDEKLREMFASADYAVCNLEGCLTLGNERTMKLGPRLKADPKVLAVYKDVGFTHLSTANNHITDYGHQAYLDTLSAIEEYGFKYMGSGASVDKVKRYEMLELEGKHVCLYNVAETMFNIPTATMAGVHLYDEYLVCNELRQLRQECDLLIVIYHGGVEYYQYPSLELKKRFHRMADSGADMVLAQHTHCIGCDEYYNSSYLLYGQGDFLFDRIGNDKYRKGLLIEVEMNASGEYVIRRHKCSVENGKVWYDKEQDLQDMETRGRMINDEVFLVENFKRFAITQKRVKTQQFVKVARYDKWLKRLLPKKWYEAFVLKNRTVNLNKMQLLRLYYTLISEQQKETALAMVQYELENME